MRWENDEYHQFLPEHIVVGFFLQQIRESKLLVLIMVWGVREGIFVCNIQNNKTHGQIHSFTWVNYMLQELREKL